MFPEVDTKVAQEKLTSCNQPETETPMVTAITALQERLSKPLRKPSLVGLLAPLAKRSMPIYLGLVILFALAGYLLLAFFPLLAFNLLLSLGDSFSAANSLLDWAGFAVRVLLMVIATALSYPLLKLRFQLPQGMELNAENAAKLCDLIEELKQEYKQPVIEQVLLRPGFAITSVKTPRFGLPFLSTNSLLIGISALQCLPPLHFKAMLARHIGLLSGIHSHVSSWLYYHSMIWLQYRDSFKQQPHLLAKPLYIVFAIYAPLFEVISFFARRHAELQADRYALDVTNDSDMAEIFSQLIITENFINQKFWPKIHQLTRRNKGQPAHLPYASMAKVLRNGLNKDDLQSWLKQAFETTTNHDEPTPLLMQRLQNIAHDKPASPRPLKETAAEHYLDVVILEKIIQKFDQRWLKQQQAH